jgi:hypothetical protein
MHRVNMRGRMSGGLTASRGSGETPVSGGDLRVVLQHGEEA